MGTYDMWFDVSQFPDEIQYMSEDINIGIDDTMYENLIMFLQRLTGANASAIPEGNDYLQTALTALDEAVRNIQTDGNDYNGGTWSDPQVTACIRQLRGENHCLNIFTFVDALCVEQEQDTGLRFVDKLTDTELKRTLLNVAVQTKGLYTGT
ncbi:hypothetical protein G647_02159 [Cladophialophora carrionii CBS 160.54]|uniref:Uncharacterized protein n=1 Tax=Cladophialophora carrionii CBS 160.54 TaxID=1279043 RepID=V9DFG2_9EURO|nr:uncharacterized protein G647_02159 [Cladophialophora carrionii CBS 160.54]ETI25386.1 hypothetical protein G647_02159 [Cladophialophora carrionii CBS 160.54]